MFLMILGVSAFQLRRKIGERSVQGRSKIKPQIGGILIQFLMDLGANMAGFWRGLGGQVGAMLGPNATKTGPKNEAKKSSLFGRPPEPILMNFWWILAPTWGGHGGSNESAFW